jgi:thymidylate kinase
MGRLICIIGIDGSGKSSQLEALLPYLEARGLRVARRWCRWRPLLLRPVQWALRQAIFLKKRWGARSQPNLSPSRADANGYASFKRSKARLFRSPVLRSLWLGGMLIDYWLQVRRTVLPALRETDVLLMDRYLPDVAVDQAIHYPDPCVGLRAILNHPLARVLPQPDVVIFLDLPPEVAFARKDDIPSLAYLSERRTAYRALATEFPIHTVDADGDFETVQRRLRYVLAGLIPSELTTVADTQNDRIVRNAPQ